MDMEMDMEMDIEMLSTVVNRNNPQQPQQHLNLQQLFNLQQLLNLQ